jgi:hypothetical protein
MMIFTQALKGLVFASTVPQENFAYLQIARQLIPALKDSIVPDFFKLNVPRVRLVIINMGKLKTTVFRYQLDLTVPILGKLTIQMRW